jgi:hypothetical protein
LCLDSANIDQAPAMEGRQLHHLQYRSSTGVCGGLDLTDKSALDH